MTVYDLFVYLFEREKVVLFLGFFWVGFLMPTLIQGGTSS